MNPMELGYHSKNFQARFQFKPSPKPQKFKATKILQESRRVIFKSLNKLETELYLVMDSNVFRKALINLEYIKDKIVLLIQWVSPLVAKIASTVSFGADDGDSYEVHRKIIKRFKATTHNIILFLRK
ncbi:hypothetical protein ACOME3_003207 [Neoechinorhynchus agilis]